MPSCQWTPTPVVFDGIQIYRAECQKYGTPEAGEMYDTLVGRPYQFCPYCGCPIVFVSKSILPQKEP